jgi:hypothetical protein
MLLILYIHGDGDSNSPQQSAESKIWSYPKIQAKDHVISHPIPREVPTSTAVGVAKPRAQGHATTSTSIASLRLKRSALPSGPAASLNRTSGHKFVPRKYLDPWQSRR